MVLYPEIEFVVKLTKITGNHEIDRNALRSIVVEKLIEERAGTGRKEKTSKYIYNVEKLSSGDKIYLTRPVPLNKGFDFIIHVKNHQFTNNKDNPKHDDIIEDLMFKKQNFPNEYKKLIKFLELIFLCHDPDVIISQNTDLPNMDGFSIDLILKVVKWFYIEQDVRYWNWSGRNMLMSRIEGI